MNATTAYVSVAMATGGDQREHLTITQRVPHDVWDLPKETSAGLRLRQVHPLELVAARPVDGLVVSGHEAG
jgi:hypothetical protein